MEDITSVLPEECIAKIISKTSPSDACRLSLVSTAFSSAAASNLVWEGFLPPDYQHIISESVSSASSQTSPLNMLSKKDLYFSLCHNPILIGNGNRVGIIFHCLVIEDAIYMNSFTQCQVVIYRFSYIKYVACSYWMMFSSW